MWLSKPSFIMHLKFRSIRPVFSELKKSYSRYPKMVFSNQIDVYKSDLLRTSTTSSTSRPRNRLQYGSVRFSSSQPISEPHICAHKIQPITAGKAVIPGSVISSDIYFEPSEVSCEFCPIFWIYSWGGKPRMQNGVFTRRFRFYWVEY